MERARLRMNRRSLALVATVLLATAACTDPSPHAPDGGAAPPAQPLDVQLTLDAGRAATANIPITGGSLSATAADGTVYTLTVPPEALVADQQITMTPIVAMKGLALGGGTLAGVQLAPEGLRFYRFARLSIAPRAAGPQRALSFSYQGAGKSLHLHPLAPETNALSMPLLHFSGAVVYLGDNISLPVRRETFTPEEWEARFEHELQQYVSEQRERALQGQPEDPQLAEKLGRAQELVFDFAVAPLLERMKTDCVFAMENLPKVLSWERWVELYGTHERNAGRIDAARAAQLQGLDACWALMTSQCLAETDTGRRQSIFTVARQAALLGLDAQKYDPFAVPRCGDTWTGTASCTSLFGEIGEAQVTWRLGPEQPGDPGVFWYVADGTVVLKNSVLEQAGCSITPNTSTIQASGFLTVDTRQKPMAYNGRGASAWTVTATCGDPPTSGPQPVAAAWFAYDDGLTDGRVMAGSSSVTVGGATLTCTHQFVRK